MATNKDKEKEQEQLQEQGQEKEQGQEGNTSSTPDPIEEAKKKAQAILEAAKEQETKIVEAAKEQAAKIKEEAVQSSSEKEELHEEKTDPMEELVDYIAPLIVGKEDQTIFVQVNGENIRIQRGKKVRIKRKFKEVLDQSAEQEMAAYAYMEKVQRDSAKAAADLN